MKIMNDQMVLPKYLYHATLKKNVPSIMQSGIRSRRFWPLVYLADTPETAALEASAGRFLMQREYELLRVKFSDLDYDLIYDIQDPWYAQVGGVYLYRGTIPPDVIEQIGTYTVKVLTNGRGYAQKI